MASSAAAAPLRPAGPPDQGRAVTDRDPVLENARYRYRKKLVRQEDGLVFGRVDSQMEPVAIGELNVQSGSHVLKEVLSKPGNPDW